jgi:hypothetical protein
MAATQAIEGEKAGGAITTKPYVPTGGKKETPTKARAAAQPIPSLVPQGLEFSTPAEGKTVL